MRRLRLRLQESSVLNVAENLKFKAPLYVESFKFEGKRYFTNRLKEKSNISTLLQKDSRGGNPFAIKLEKEELHVTSIYVRMHFIVIIDQTRVTTHREVSRKSRRILLEAGFHGRFERRNANLAESAAARQASQRK